MKNKSILSLQCIQELRPETGPDRSRPTRIKPIGFHKQIDLIRFQIIQNDLAGSGLILSTKSNRLLLTIRRLKLVWFPNFFYHYKTRFEFNTSDQIVCMV